MSGPSPPQPSVLVVDDDPGIADMYAGWLRSVCSVRTAYGGSEALETLDGTVDVVLLDRRMPDLSGDDVLAELRDRGYDPLVGMVTAVEPDVDVAELDWDVYLTKPVSKVDLFDAVDRLLRRTTYQDDVRRYFALASRKATLEAEKLPEELAGSEEYARLSDELEAVRERIGHGD